MTIDPHTNMQRRAHVVACRMKKMGKLTCQQTGKVFDYEIRRGFDLKLTLDLHTSWDLARRQILDELVAAHPNALDDEASLYPLLSEYNLEDFGWNWLNKAVHMMPNRESYTWFYLVVEDKVQAVCITFHPKTSRLDKAQIFYVDFLAAAYWNRPRPNYQRQFSSLGTILLKHCVAYGTEVLKLRLGFCLHSLKGAERFYERIGMKDFGIDEAKEGLRYFEADDAACTKLLEATL